ncbi:MAG: Lrp/AsnC family transcriptional regulator [Methanosarcinales archaeon]|nr:Lrp/AsnC family transcriptional regulator [Methanosarcinales archaeon]
MTCTDEVDLQILAAVQECFPLESRPYLCLAREIGIPEEEIMSRIDRLKSEGLIRRIGPILDLRRLGRSGVLVALKVPEEEADGVSLLVNQFEEISHNYLRPSPSGYNMWFTISAGEDRIQEILSEIRSLTGRPQLVLPTRRIFKIGVKFDIL